MVRDLDKELKWEIESKDIFTNTTSDFTTNWNQVHGYKAISRNDSGGILSVMKNSYSPMTNTEFLDTVSKIKEISGFQLAGFNEFKGGKKVLAFLENNREDFYIGGHKIKDYFLLGNSFDGSSSFFQGTSTVLIRCTNQFSKIETMTKIRHTKSIGRKLEEYYIYLDSYFNQRDELYKTFERAAEFKLTEELQEQMIKFVLGIKESLDKELSAHKQNQIEMLRNNILSETKDLGENLWGAFNGVTKYTSHDLVSKTPTFGNVFGIQADINNKAIDFVNQKLVLA
jgi:hypothetical protein